MNHLKKIKVLLKKNSQKPFDIKISFYKTGVGQYAEHDQFIGVSVPILRKISQTFSNLTFDEIQILISSPINEERLLALFILTNRYQNSHSDNKDDVCRFYVRNLQYVNNWNLVDASAHKILGAHLLHTNKDILITLAKSNILWQRRIAIVSTLYFIRHGVLQWTFQIAEILLNDKQDLIHKAVGWMLREAGKKDEAKLIAFLDECASQMPRTMLRYALEKFPIHQRKLYLALKM